MPTSKSKNIAVKDLIQVFESQFFKAMAEPVRIDILKFILINGRSDIATVAKTIKKDRSVISRHLHIMVEAGLLSYEKVSRNSYFEIDGKELRTKVYTLFQKVDSAINNCCS